jgi:ParE toxin of type II toxin-antitoxin system, parDE
LKTFSELSNTSGQENPAAAQGIASTIYESAGSLKSFPNKGRTGRVDGTRDLPLPPLPFVVVYRIGLSFTVAEKGALPFCPLSRHLRDLPLAHPHLAPISPSSDHSPKSLWFNYFAAPTPKRCPIKQKRWVGGGNE